MMTVIDADRYTLEHCRPHPMHICSMRILVKQCFLQMVRLLSVYIPLQPNIIILITIFKNVIKKKFFLNQQFLLKKHWPMHSND